MRKHITFSADGIGASTREWGRRLGIPQGTLGRWLSQGMSLEQAADRFKIGGIELIRQARTTHGMRNSKTYRVWRDMHSRCENNKVEHYFNYGGRGIRVCEAWRSFERFFADMGERPEGKSLDRMNNDGNYESENCRWATVAEQSRNRSTNRFIVVGGERMTVSEAARKYSISKSTIAYRLNHGYDGSESVLTGRACQRAL